MRRGSRFSQVRNASGVQGLQKNWRGERIGFLGFLRELILAVLCAVMPWWFGASDPPAVFVILWLIFLLAVLTLVDSLLVRRRNGLSWRESLTTIPVFGLGVLALFGLLQISEIGPDMLQKLSPARYDLWKAWGGADQVKLTGSDLVVTQPARLAWLGVEVYESVLWLGALWVVAVCVMRLPGRWGPLKRHSMIMMISGVLMGIQSMLQALTFQGKILWVRPAGIVVSSAGPFFVHSHLAAYLNMCLGFALAYLLFQKWNSDALNASDDFFKDNQPGFGRGFLGIYAAGIILVAVMASGSRGGIMAGMVAMAALVLLIMLRWRQSAGSSEGGLSWLAALVFVVAFGLTMLTDVVAVFDRFQAITGSAGTHAAGIRTSIWAIAWRVWQMSPVWGTGWGSFFWSSQPLYDAVVRDLSHAESDYVQVLPEGGVLGALIVLMILGGVGFGLFKLIGRSRESNHLALVGGALFAVVAVAWGSITENNLRTAGVAVPALITVAHVARMAVVTKRFHQEKLTDSDEATLRQSGLMDWVCGLVTGLVLCVVSWLGVQQTSLVKQAWDITGPVGIQAAGVEMLGFVRPETKDVVLEDQKVALDQLGTLMPGWGDYRIRQALVNIELYQRKAKAALEARSVSAKDAEDLSQTLRLAVSLKELPVPERATLLKTLIKEPLVENYLVWAAASLALAWQEQPSSALTHAEMAILNWAYDEGPAVSDSLKRALNLSGERVDVLLRTGQVASALGETSIAQTAFAKSFEIKTVAPEAIAGQMRSWLSDDMVDSMMDQSALVAVRVGENLVSENQVDRRRMAGEKALDKLRGLGNTSDAFTALIRARAMWLLGDRESALSQIKTVTALAPGDLEPRILQLDWLIAEGRPAEALEQARVMAYLWPDNETVKKCLDRAAEADAIGSRKSNDVVEKLEEGK